jgi:hypothetical protein
MVILAMAMVGAAQTASVPAGHSAGEAHAVHQVRALKITVLVTNLAGDPGAGAGEWGFSALVEVDGHKI